MYEIMNILSFLYVPMRVLSECTKLWEVSQNLPETFNGTFTLTVEFSSQHLAPLHKHCGGIAQTMISTSAGQISGSGGGVAAQTSRQGAAYELSMGQK